VDISTGASALADVTVDDRVRIFLLAIVRCFEGGALVSFEMYVFVVVVVLEIAHALFLLELYIALSVLVAGVGTGFATGDRFKTEKDLPEQNGSKQRKISPNKNSGRSFSVLNRRANFSGRSFSANFFGEIFLCFEPKSGRSFSVLNRRAKKKKISPNKTVQNRERSPRTLVGSKQRKISPNKTWVIFSIPANPYQPPFF
jgi:hypothetical protein